ncbi:MAG: response regulator transcription factor [Oscillospiraceae bacterium]|nr:response regulator transcription factor [Oscillospiraceae bacterium]
MARILAVDDERDILTLLRNVLELDGHSVTTVDDPVRVERLSLNEYDLIILDVRMPGVDGFELCRRIRETVDCPILFLTAKTEEADLLYGFGVGADDYIVKPFGLAALRARIAAHLRRERREKHSVMRVDGMQFDLLSNEATIDGNRIPLTKGEYGITLLLARNSGQVFSKERIYEAVFGFDGDADSSVITEHVRGVRAKFAPYGGVPIKTIWGVGYQWRSGRSENAGQQS